MPQPVAVLLRQSLLLSSAIDACQENTKPKPVHQLRSTTRRIEATLELLAASATIPGLKSTSKTCRKHLSKFRRAAGKVRDLDVHRDLLAALNTPKNPARKDIATLDESLVKAREKSAHKLRQLIQKDRQKLQLSFDKLESTLKPAIDLNLSGAHLVNEARHWLAHAIRHLDPKHDEQLHTIRKACKTARYIAEIGSDTSKAAASLASSLEKLQQAAGEWHDHLVLLEEARTTLPEDSLLIRNIQEEASRLRHLAESQAKHRLATL